MDYKSFKADPLTLMRNNKQLCNKISNKNTDDKDKLELCRVTRQAAPHLIANPLALRRLTF